MLYATKNVGSFDGGYHTDSNAHVKALAYDAKQRLASVNWTRHKYGFPPLLNLPPCNSTNLVAHAIEGTLSTPDANTVPEQLAAPFRKGIYFNTEYAPIVGRFVTRSADPTQLFPTPPTITSRPWQRALPPSSASDPTPAQAAASAASSSRRWSKATAIVASTATAVYDAMATIVCSWRSRLADICRSMVAIERPHVLDSWGQSDWTVTRLSAYANRCSGLIPALGWHQDRWRRFTDPGDHELPMLFPPLQGLGKTVPPVHLR